MERWHNRVAVVTGASSGIGAACTNDLAKAGLIVIGIDRNAPLVEAKNRIHYFKCDVTNEQQVVNTFAMIEEKFGGVDILINNAGIVRDVQLVGENNSDDLKAIMETNVLGVAYCTREAFKSMKSRSFDGHVININSITGHYIPSNGGRFSFNIYPASKHALTAMTEIYRLEFFTYGTRIKVTSISPGAVKTSMLPAGLFEKINCLSPENISDAVMYAIRTPPNVQIHELIIKPIGEPL